MAFGRLIIATENGELAEYELTKRTTSVGRQPGNDVVLNAEGISRYHAQLDVDDSEQVFLIDLDTVNGTFLNDQQVQPEARNALKDGDMIALGDIRLTYMAAKRKAGTGPLTLKTTEIENAEVPIRLVMDDPSQAIAPGAQLQLALLIHNKSGVERMFTVDTGGLEPGWVKVNRREVRLEEDEQTEVLLSIRPPRMSETRPGSYPLTIRVAFKDDPEQAVEASRAVDVLGYSGLGMNVRESESRVGHYYLAVQNQGNEPMSVDLAGYQRERLLRYQFEKQRITLEPGETVQTSFQVAPTGKIQNSKPLAFAVVAHSLDAAAFSAPMVAFYHESGDGEAFTGAAWVAGLLSVPMMGLAFVALIVLAGVLVYVGVIPRPGWWPVSLVRGGPGAAVAVTATISPPTATPEPTIIPTPVVQITTFSAQPTKITFGTVETISFAWDVMGIDKASTYIIKIGESGELRIGAEQWATRRLEVPVGSLVNAGEWGENTYTLEVMGNDGISRSSAIKITITPVRCTIGDGAQIYELPDSDSLATSAPASGEVAIGGRTEDRAWLQVWSLADHNLMGWVETRALTCPLEPTLDEYIVTQPGP